MPGIRVGHWTGPDTGVTVIWAPAGTVASGEVRGGAPATRETALLEPGRLVDRVDAVVLTGGSAFGLAAAEGVVRFLAERGQGFPTAAGPVPIVVAAALFDLPVARPPGPDEGYAAAVAAGRGEPAASGRIGAGTGATLGKWKGREYAVPGGLGTASVTTAAGIVVGALVAVNAAGDVLGSDGSIVAGSTAPESVGGFGKLTPFEQTTLAVVATNAPLDKVACHLVAQSVQDGLTRSLRPAHTRFDGDIAFVLATGAGGPQGQIDLNGGDLELIREAAAEVTASAVRAGATLR